MTRASRSQMDLPHLAKYSMEYLGGACKLPDVELPQVQRFCAYLGSVSERAKGLGRLGEIGSCSPVLLQHVVIGRFGCGRGRKGKSECWKQSLALQSLQASRREVAAAATLSRSPSSGGPSKVGFGSSRRAEKRGCASATCSKSEETRNEHLNHHRPPEGIRKGGVQRTGPLQVAQKCLRSDFKVTFR